MSTANTQGWTLPILKDPDVIRFPLVEIFHSVEGEGLMAGTPMLFVRFAKCNLACSFCDTPYNRGAITADLESLVSLILKTGVRWIKFTGGEPTLQNGLSPLVKALMMARPELKFAIETNGMIWNEALPLIHYVVVSPKFHDGTADLPDDRIVSPRMRELKECRPGEFRICISRQFGLSTVHRERIVEFLKSMPEIKAHAIPVLFSPEFAPHTSLPDGWKSGDGHMGATGAPIEGCLTACRFLVHHFANEGYGARISIQSHKLLGAR